MSEAAAKVKSIFVYPIKSCRGISVTHASIVSTGFRSDRQWVVVNSRGRGCTQRVEPKLALVETELPSEAFSEGWEPSSDSYLVMRAPGMDALKVHLGEPRDMVDISVWEWSGSAFDEGSEAAEWFSKFLGKICTASQVRNADDAYADGYRNMFTDLFPFLLASQESLDAVNTVLKETVSINRFRPNILVEGCEPLGEDLWKEIHINNSLVPCVDQETGIPGSEPGETLKTFRSDTVMLPNKKPQGKVYFGLNLVCKECFTEEMSKVVQVGDEVFVKHQLSSTDEATV